MVDCISCGQHYDMDKQDMFCPHPPLNQNKLPRVITPDKLRVVLKSGRFFDMDINAGFDMRSFMGTVRLNGYILNERLYVDQSSIETVFTWLASEGEPFNKDERNIRLSPGTETQQ
jgi:hypothetical protein